MERWLCWWVAVLAGVVVHGAETLSCEDAFDRGVPRGMLSEDAPRFAKGESHCPDVDRVRQALKGDGSDASACEARGYQEGLRIQTGAVLAVLGCDLSKWNDWAEVDMHGKERVVVTKTTTTTSSGSDPFSKTVSTIRQQATSSKSDGDDETVTTSTTGKALSDGGTTKETTVMQVPLNDDVDSLTSRCPALVGPDLLKSKGGEFAQTLVKYSVVGIPTTVAECAGAAESIQQTIEASGLDQCELVHLQAALPAILYPACRIDLRATSAGMTVSYETPTGITMPHVIGTAT
ncbi:Uncharacterized protein PBTT_10107 [Plasmodiophora brassicae]